MWKVLQKRMIAMKITALAGADADALKVYVWRSVLLAGSNQLSTLLF
jgi:hypothetical protein